MFKEFIAEHNRDVVQSDKAIYKMVFIYWVRRVSVLLLY